LICRLCVHAHGPWAGAVRPSLNERAAYELLTHPRDSPFPSFSHFLLYEWRISPRSVDVVAIEKGDPSVRTAVHIDGNNTAPLRHALPTQSLMLSC
jgi:hypothetical protein